MIENLKETLQLLFDADADRLNRQELLRQLTPSQLEWYFDHGYIQ